MVSLLPDPAPATTTMGSSGAAITSACSGVGAGMPSFAAISSGLRIGFCGARTVSTPVFLGR